MIRFQQVSKRYPGSGDALSELTLEVDAGEMVFLTGHSGAGKSTLLKLIALIERPTRGQVLIIYRHTSGVSRRAIPGFRRDLGIVFQDHKLLQDRTVFDNVGLPLVIAGLRRKEVGKRVRAALDQVGLLDKEGSMPLALSTGEQQRIGIARAVVAKPPLVIADAPPGNLDPQLALESMNLVCRFPAVGPTTLNASPDLALLDRLGRRRVELKEGRLAADSHGPSPGHA